MSYFPNPAIGGVAEMTEYENAVLTGFDQTNTYHPVVDAAVSGSTLDGWTYVDKCSAGSILTTTGPQCMSNQCCLPIAAGDILTLAGNNQTDSNDFTLVNMNFQLKRYER